MLVTIAPLLLFVPAVLFMVGLLQSSGAGMGRGSGFSFRNPTRPQQAAPGNAVGTVGYQGVPFTRTAAGAEGSFTTTTVTLPASAKPTYVLVAVSASSAQVQVVSVGKRFWAGVVTTNLPLYLDISGLPPGTSVDVQTEANAALVVSGVVGYTD